jgi:uncharacterized protein (DUF1800 family)
LYTGETGCALTRAMLKLIVAFALLLPGLAAAQGMGAADARHLLNRTGFDARLEEIDVFARFSRREGVERLLAGARGVARTPAPHWVKEWTDPRRIRQMDAETRRLFVRGQVERGLELKGWWLTEMVGTESPLTERMTLFWHNHFTSGLEKVRSPALMYQQNVLLRRHALGNFAELLHAASKDPAMVVYLDAATNRRGQPNENFAREVMELFTLGEGNYGEGDIREAARAFTGWSIELETGAYLFRRRQHDDAEKTVLGRSGNLRGEDVLDILLAQPASAEFVAAKLWREFVSPQPDPAGVARVAGVFRASGYDTRSALRTLLMTEGFWAPENRAALIKSPAELVAGTLRQFDIGFGDPLPFVLLLRALGQDILSPPNVKGWAGGEAWINSTTLLARKQFLDRVFRVEEARMAMQQPAAQEKMAALKPGARRFMQAIADLQFSAHDWQRPFEGRGAMVPVVLLAAAPAGSPSGEGMDYVRALVADPVYQLK